MGPLAGLRERAGLPEGVIGVRLGIEEGAPSGHRRPADPRGPGEGQLRHAHGLRGRRQLYAHRAGGDLRPGPVVIAYGDEHEAVRIANDSEYGLSGGVWSADEAHALAVARRVRTGTVTVNGAPVAFGGPFGGFKASGIGREYGAVGLGSYTEYKTITSDVPMGWRHRFDR